jgi:hypothetical protein
MPGETMCSTELAKWLNTITFCILELRTLGHATDFRLYNDTHSTLKFKSKTATRGGWVSMPPLTIAPFKNVSFFMEKLSSDVPSGSEGF